MPTTHAPHEARPRLASATAMAAAGLTLTFGWILLLDLRLYGALPDPSLLPIQLLLAATTLLAASRWRWGPTAAAVVAAAAGIGSAAQPITLVRLTAPETLGLQVGTILLLLFAVATTAVGVPATVGTIRQARHRAGP